MFNSISVQMSFYPVMTISIFEAHRLKCTQQNPSEISVAGFI